MTDATTLDNAIGVIGGSGLYELEGLTDIEEIKVETPFGEPSDVFISGQFGGRRVCFLPRHGRGHRILPSELNHRANIWGLRSLNVRWIIAVTAVGSLREEYRPRDIVLPDQFYDRTSRRAEHTFFGNGIVAHVEFGDPISTQLRELLFETAEKLGKTVHNGGTYVNMDGPAFSTRAESETNRQLGFDLIGMTNLPEAKLAREAEIALATIAMVTDYDCWKAEEHNVNAHSVIEHIQANAVSAREILEELIPQIPTDPDWPEHNSLDNALFTPREIWPTNTAKALQPILSRFIDS
ncbi:MAG: S-methyl-5'-thioadenosine phosphorylase [Verrucomicrobiales bacterium]|jgi:5'-methylthioadenosine phosphorylase|nr:S-methyl-5'-thioadenosine phosphorylase [Verrucomicrobiales bacterium]|tara:strand:- start:2769 stop:3653 length:885 start_codon:yes stop_codon:yes gene_type:complete